MWRAFFLSLGIFLCVMGLECLVMDKAVLAGSRFQPTAAASFAAAPMTPAREVKPPEWAPWSLLSGGAIVIIYSLTLKRGG
jgi:hypothetical protein